MYSGLGKAYGENAWDGALRWRAWPASSAMVMAVAPGKYMYRAYVYGIFVEIFRDLGGCHKYPMQFQYKLISWRFE